ncbi:MAG: transcription antitermination factor NusB [Candidatus Hydrogenedentes bacterium]|nr:transcription antitermination factor NusB [Candidatus Hydrogenedentota bacterium]
MSVVSPKMRRSARERAVQFLFGLDFTEYNWHDAIEDFWHVNQSRPGVKDYAETLIGGVIEHRPKLDELIAANLDKWTPDRVGRVERNVMRVALFEILYRPDVPRAVAINEAIEVAKRYGADDSARFINGVLDRIKEQNE